MGIGLSRCDGGCRDDDDDDGGGTAAADGNGGGCGVEAGTVSGCDAGTSSN